MISAYSSCHIAYIFFYDLCHQKFRHPVIFVIFLILQYFHFICQCLIRCHKFQCSVITSSMKLLCSYHIFYLMCISHKIFCTDFRSWYPDKISYCLNLDRHISPGILHQSQSSFRWLSQIFKQHSFSLQCQENAFFLLDSHHEFFHRLLTERPFTHIVIKIESTFIFIF